MAFKPGGAKALRKIYTLLRFLNLMISMFMLGHGQQQKGGLVIRRTTSGSQRSTAPIAASSISSETQAAETEASRKPPSRSAIAKGKEKASDGYQSDERRADEDMMHMNAELSALKHTSRSHARTASASVIDINLPSSSRDRHRETPNRYNDSLQGITAQETPINHKNKKMRAEGGRRVSNGKRLSSSLGNSGAISKLTKLLA
jgi:hypothetical protein